MQEEMSEECGGSDRAGINAIGNVRRMGKFGQSRDKCKRKCPKTEEVRTEQGKIQEEMSEDRGSSDKARKNVSENVRLWSQNTDRQGLGDAKMETPSGLEGVFSHVIYLLRFFQKISERSFRRQVEIQP
jgi:hypothetical protein